VPAPVNADAIRAHPLVRQAMEVFDATSIRVRAAAVTAPEPMPPEGAADDVETAALINPSHAPERGP
jgi:hypothetical protein